VKGDDENKPDVPWKENKPVSPILMEILSQIEIVLQEK
jgi:hypothetical protein